MSIVQTRNMKYVESKVSGCNSVNVVLVFETIKRHILWRYLLFHFTCCISKLLRFTLKHNHPTFTCLQLCIEMFLVLISLRNMYKIHYTGDITVVSTCKLTAFNVVYFRLFMQFVRVDKVVVLNVEDNHQ